MIELLQVERYYLTIKHDIRNSLLDILDKEKNNKSYSINFTMRLILSLSEISDRFLYRTQGFKLGAQTFA